MCFWFGDGVWRLYGGGSSLSTVSLRPGFTVGSLLWSGGGSGLASGPEGWENRSVADWLFWGATGGSGWFVLYISPLPSISQSVLMPGKRCRIFVISSMLALFRPETMWDMLEGCTPISWAKRVFVKPSSLMICKIRSFIIVTFAGYKGKHNIGYICNVLRVTFVNYLLFTFLQVLGILRWFIAWKERMFCMWFCKIIFIYMPVYCWCLMVLCLVWIKLSGLHDLLFHEFKLSCACFVK